MPIRFRCAYSNQLMGIARRKAGSVVNCPKCKGQVVVPSPVDAPAPEQNPFALGSAHPVPAPSGAAEAGAVFERSDFEYLFQPVPHSPQHMHAETLPPGAASAVAPAPMESMPGLQFERLAPSPAKRGILLTPLILAIASVAVVLLMGLAFILGIMVGRSS